MTYDSTAIENDPFLIEMRREVSELEKRKDELFKASDADPDNVKVRLHYDASVIMWARATNNYHNALKAVLGL